MKRENGKTEIRMTTIVLSVVLVLVIIGSCLFFIYFPQIRKYLVDHRSYPVYGGMTGELKDSELFNDMQSGKSICFLGDSITYGTLVDGIPWYQPLIPYITGEVSSYSYGGWTVNNLIYESDHIPDADIYIIAIGINDILALENEDSAKTAEEFAARCSELGDLLTVHSPDAKLYFISPWSFIDADAYRVERGVQFRPALEEICMAKGYYYINPDPIIQSVLEEEGSSKYMLNGFHPNIPNGVGLFSYAVLMDAHNRSPKT